MIEFRLTVTDLAETSFAISALQEAVFSVRIWRAPGLFAIHLPWMRDVDARRQALDWEILDALVSPRRWLPDFLTPRPAAKFRSFVEELDLVRATPPRVVKQDFLLTYDGRPVPQIIERRLGRPGALLDRIATALDEYWTSCLEPWWPRMRAVLEADVVYQSRQLAQRGARGLFAKLSDQLHWSAGVLRMDTSLDASVDVSGRGLVLVPSIFARKPMTMITPDVAPVVVYPARGRGTVWESSKPTVDGALVRLIGEPRALLLDLLRRPATTTELALQLGVTPGAVSQHLKALREAGLVTGSRAGRSVLYLRSPLGDQLTGAR